MAAGAPSSPAREQRGRRRSARHGKRGAGARRGPLGLRELERRRALIRASAASSSPAAARCASWTRCASVARSPRLRTGAASPSAPWRRQVPPSPRRWSSGSSATLGRWATARPARPAAGATSRRAQDRCSSFAMIGMVGEDRCRAEQLLGEHRADQQMRPGRRAERQQQVGRRRARARHGRRRRRSGSGPRACRRRASPRALRELGRAQSACRARRARR